MRAFWVALEVKNYSPTPCQCRRGKRYRFDPWARKIPWRRAWQPTPVFLPGESPGTEVPGGLQSMGSQRVGHDWSDWACMYRSHEGNKAEKTCCRLMGWLWIGGREASWISRYMSWDLDGGMKQPGKSRRRYIPGRGNELGLGRLLN